jgi:hypothetical protein
MSQRDFSVCYVSRGVSRAFYTTSSWSRIIALPQVPLSRRPKKRNFYMRLRNFSSIWQTRQTTYQKIMRPCTWAFGIKSTAETNTPVSISNQYVKHALSLLGDNDPNNDMDGYRLLGRMLAKAGETLTPLQPCSSSTVLSQRDASRENGVCLAFTH